MTEIEDHGDHSRPLRWYHLFVLAPIYAVMGPVEFFRRARCKVFGHKIAYQPCYFVDYCSRCHTHLD